MSSSSSRTLGSAFALRLGLWYAVLFIVSAVALAVTTYVLLARALAAQADVTLPLGGVPIAIKDLAPTAGIRTTYSSRAFADNVPDFDSAVVRRIREAGFVIVGKTNTP